MAEKEPSVSRPSSLTPLGTGNRDAIIRYCLHLTAGMFSPLVALGWTVLLLRMEMFSIINSSKISQKVGDWLAVVVFAVAQVYPLCFHRRIVKLFMCALWLENTMSRFFFLLVPKG